MALRLPRIPTGLRVTNPDGTVTNTFQIWWQQIAVAIESNVNGIQDALAAAGIALDAAAVALDAADAANSAADATASESSIVNSYVTNFVGTSPVSADSAGLVTIANHDRVYGNGDVVSVLGGSIATGEVSPSVVRVYYDQPSRAGGAVTYQWTLVPADASQTGDRHSVGAVEIPAAGSVDGGFVRPPGFSLTTPI